MIAKLANNTSVLMRCQSDSEDYNLTQGQVRLMKCAIFDYTNLLSTHKYIGPFTCHKMTDMDGYRLVV